jgi:putative ABC transport system substrate-binding protein
MDGRPTRRRFVQGAGVAGLGLLAGCGRLPGQTQPSHPVKLHRIGILNNSGPRAAFTEPFRRGLAELGYLEGQNIVIEWRGDEAHAERLAQNAAELVALNVELIVTLGDHRAQAAKAATSTIPIVMSSVVDPVGSGLIESFGRPGGNVTGPIEGHPELHGKRLQLLGEIAPGMTRVTAIGQRTPTYLAIYEELEDAAQSLGLQLRVVREPTAEALDDALAREAGERTDALYVVHSGFILSQHAKILDFATRKRLPAMYGNRLYAENGGLAAYGVDVLHMYYRTATYVDKILKGAKPADLPVEQPMRFEFVVNLTTAAALGITFPEPIRLQVTEVIR